MGEIERFPDLSSLIKALDEHFPTWNMMGDLIDVGERSATTRLVPAPLHLRPGGTVSGPAQFAMADVCMYLAILWELGPQAAPCVTADMHSRFLKAASPEIPLICTAKLIRVGKTLIIGEAQIRQEGSDDAVGLFTASYTAPRPIAPA